MSFRSLVWKSIRMKTVFIEVYEEKDAETDVYSMRKEGGAVFACGAVAGGG